MTTANRFFHPAKVLLIGLILSQAAAAYFIYRSNLSIFYECQILSDAGYLIVPNKNVLFNLVKAGSAFKGGLFFTLSFGAGLSVASIVAAWIWRKIFGAHKWFLLLFILAWAAGLVFGNLRGFNPFFSILGFFIPLVAFPMANRFVRKSEGSGGATGAIGFMLPLVIIGLLWTTQADKSVFTDIRDFLLWSNPAGRWMTDAYYNNTLYAAESFKSLNQKTLKPAMVHASDPNVKSRIEQALMKLDYLPLSVAGPTDLDVEVTDAGLILKHRGRVVLRTPLDAFLGNPRQTMKRFSDKTDINHVFRRATYYSILFGSTLAFYFILYGILQWLFGLVSGSGVSAILAGLGCLALMAMLLGPVALHRHQIKDAPQTAQLLQSGKWQDQVVGLRMIFQNKEDISNYPIYKNLLKSPHVPVRYWTARAMGLSRRSATYQSLLKLLDDPEITVVCQAYQALGNRPRVKNIPNFIKRIQDSGHWYVQWNAYHSLKDQGWTQKRSP